MTTVVILTYLIGYDTELCLQESILCLFSSSLSTPTISHVQQYPAVLTTRLCPTSAAYVCSREGFYSFLSFVFIQERSSQSTKCNTLYADDGTLPSSLYAATSNTPAHGQPCIPSACHLFLNNCCPGKLNKNSVKRQASSLHSKTSIFRGQIWCEFCLF